MDKMIANGDTPLCVGIESGTATGWPFTDWVEELILRQEGIDYYNQWVAHEIPFNDQPVIDAFNEVAGPDGLWTKKGAVFAAGGSIAATAFGDNGEPLVEGKCMMHRQANFFAAFFPEGTEFGDGDRRGQHVLLPVRRGSPGPGRRHQRGGVPRRPRGVEGDGVPRLDGVRQRPAGGAEPSASVAASPASSPATRTPTRRGWSDARAGLPRDAADGRVRPRSTRPTRCRPTSGRARSGPRARRSSTVTRTPRRRRPTSRPPGRADCAETSRVVAERRPRAWCR